MNGKAGRAIAVFILLFAVAWTSTVASAKAKPAGPKERQYLAFNIWYERPERVWSTLYEKGAMLKTGTEVTHVEVGRSGIEFDAEGGLHFNMVWNEKHRPGASIDAFAKTMITTKDFAALTAGFTGDEVDAIKAGTVRTGMSKAAVIAAVGIPPEHRTPSTDLDVWTFWYDRFRSYTVHFADGKVTRIDK